MSFLKASAIFTASSLALAAFSQVASATYIIGPDAFDVPPYTLNAAVNGQQGWTGSATGATIANGPAGTGSTSAIFIDNEQSGSNALRSIPAPYSTDTTQIMRVKFDIRGTLDSTNFLMPRVQIGDMGASDFAAVMLEGMAAGAGVSASQFRLNGDNTKLVSGISSAPNVWYTVTVDLSFGSKIYDISITDGTNTGTATNVPFWYDSASLPVPKLGGVAFQKATSNTYPNDSGYIDNFSVEMIPEPAAMSLLGLGALGMIRRRS